MNDKFALQLMCAILRPLPLGDVLTFAVGLFVCDPDKALELISALGTRNMPALADALVIMRIKMVDPHEQRPHKPTEFGKN